jgi:predicted CXXCH cytochrome family protein
LGGQLPNSTNHDPTDIMGKSHPIINVPAKKVYYTPHKPAPTVTFYHEEHIELFGLRCVNCHRQENCNYCHDIDKPVRPAKSQEEVHAVCSGCHQTDGCNKCHDTRERPGFTHASTGWPLNRYHNSLDCRACHPTGRKIAKLNRECTTCHNWNAETFAHEVTGLQLDEIHAQIDCADCHTGNKYSAAPACASCHDDNRSVKAKPPGKFIKVAAR